MEKGQISEILEEIEELKQGVDDLRCACQILTKIVENICGCNAEDVDVSIKVSQASVKAKVGRERLFGFCIDWSSRIHHFENKPRNHHIELSKAQYATIKRYINTILAGELKAFEEREDLNKLSTYVFCARTLDYAITEELEKGIEKEDVENTRQAVDAESNEIIEENGGMWVISRFKLESGSLALVRTRFQQNGIYYDNQSLWGQGMSSRLDVQSEPKIITSLKGEKMFIFSYEQYGTVCCVIFFNAEKNQHQCRLLISKE